MNNMKPGHLVVGVLAITVIALFFMSSGTTAVGNSTVASLTKQVQLEQKTNEGGEVTIDITPRIDPASNVWEFEVALNTHTVKLPEDLTAVSALTDEQGNATAAVAWDGPTGGHHLSGILRFPAPSVTPRQITVSMKGIGGVATRDFTWQLAQ
ncbi:MAG: hypothetical protein A3B30_02145 [Candidatus Komeilibacteria bacterium RIFCSPLOWO2_01_FULL_52_15]|uniref:Uncharacterized protein n=2 Tax=Candidatus Komeiliibacteriota TaxID=1817908 RepID=A0A1G2BV91_9BACT|nr:MAG: hypothetical protein A3B30_02145 [Candidatus Komeilibacteria bacterium RIFCSPLOWO2_01_FULL_52_15]